jgi:hypothetical protein
MIGTDMSDAADSLLNKLKEFAGSLEPEERELFAALIAPGVAAAHGDVEGFDVGWSITAMPDSLADAITDRDLRIEGW